MKRIILMSFLVLAGCGEKPPRPAVPVIVDKPVPVACKTVLPQEPGWDVDALPIGSDVWDQMAALRAERLQRIGYEGQLKAAIQACQ